jgi:hypothetical protein
MKHRFYNREGRREFIKRHLAMHQQPEPERSMVRRRSEPGIPTAVKTAGEKPSCHARTRDAKPKKYDA